MYTWNNYEHFIPGTCSSGETSSKRRWHWTDVVVLACFSSVPGFMRASDKCGFSMQLFFLEAELFEGGKLWQNVSYLGQIYKMSINPFSTSSFKKENRYTQWNKNWAQPGNETRNTFQGQDKHVGSRGTVHQLQGQCLSATLPLQRKTLSLSHKYVKKKRPAF